MKLEDYIQEMLPMSPSKATQIAEKYNLEEFSEGDFILKEGKISTGAYYLESGYLRSFAIDTDGIEVTTRIYGPSTFFNDYLSYFKKEPTRESYEALTNCKVWSISFDDMNFLFHNMPEFREFGRMLLTMNYVKVHSRMLGMIQETAEQRYIHLLEERPDIFQHVPLKIIASYLGVTDSSLSRIRREVAKKNH